MKKILLTFTVIPVTAAFLWGIWSISGLLLSMKVPQGVQMPSEMHFSPPGEYNAGQVLTFKADFTLPRYRKILDCTLSPVQNCVPVQKPRIRKIKSSWRYAAWQVEAPVCCLAPGKSGQGELRLEITPVKKETAPENFTLKIPAFEIKVRPVSGPEAPELASEVRTPPGKISPWHWLWTLLLLIPLLLWFIFRKRPAGKKKLSLRRRTLDSLESLRNAVISRHLSAREGIAGVSDQLRFYLEERFSLQDSGKTTPEFLEDVEYNSLLPEKANVFLKNFLNSADMIKFAQAPCDPAAVSTAVDRAVELVENTALPETEEKDV